MDCLPLSCRKGSQTELKQLIQLLSLPSLTSTYKSIYDNATQQQLDKKKARTSAHTDVHGSTPLAARGRDPANYMDISRATPAQRHVARQTVAAGFQAECRTAFERIPPIPMEEFPFHSVLHLQSFDSDAYVGVNPLDPYQARDVPTEQQLQVLNAEEIANMLFLSTSALTLHLVE